MSHGVQTVRTPEKRAIVLEALADGLTLREAAKSAGIGRATLWEWRQADPAFERECRDAYNDGTDKLEEVARNRAFAGSDLLLIFLLRQRDAERFNKRMVEVRVAGNVNHQHSVADTDPERGEVVHFYLPPNGCDQPSLEEGHAKTIDASYEVSDIHDV
jgi:hypothetical protein